jgi:hypothetical protein
MQTAVRGNLLNLHAGGRERLDSYRPLSPPPRPTDADERLARWRAQAATAWPKTALDPPPAYDEPLPEDEPEDIAGEGTLIVDEPVEW